MLLWIVLLNAMISLSVWAHQCTHPIFCNTEILDAISKSPYFSDSKTFMDQILIVPIQKALYMFKTVPLSKFLSDCFADPDSVLIKTTLNDFKEIPETFAKIKKPSLRSFALQLNKRWNQLAKKVNLNSLTFSTCKQNCSTFLPEMDKQTIIIPGGRFRQSHYWDTFWIIKGLIACDMLQTSQMLARNMMLMIDKYGFIPSGSRLYYLNRSQPPFFSLIIKQIVQAYRKKGLSSKAEAFEKQCYDYMIREFTFWKYNRLGFVFVGQKMHIVFFYLSQTTIPRWQSYRQDVKTASGLSQQQKKKLYLQINSMAQSGWDFSSRWFANKTDIKSAHIASLIVPTDLNAILGITAYYLYDLAVKFEDPQAIQLQKIIEFTTKYFNAIKVKQFEPNYYADYTYDQPDKNLYPPFLYPYLFFNQKLDQNPYHTIVSPSTSNIKGGQQWDKPNVWAPNNWLLHQILVDRQAIKVAQQWINTVYCGWKKTGNIYEKYRQDVLGERGEGGQYEVQTGFGWTNGLALYYLVKYGNKLDDPPC